MGVAVEGIDDAFAPDAAARAIRENRAPFSQTREIQADS
jgi:hypothetical protein